MCFFAFYIYVVLKWAIEQFGMTVEFWLADRNQMIMNGYQEKQKKLGQKEWKLTAKTLLKPLHLSKSSMMLQSLLVHHLVIMKE